MSDSVRYNGEDYTPNECSVCHYCGTYTPYEFLESCIDDRHSNVFVCTNCEGETL